LVKAIHYMLKRWHAFTLFLDDGRVCMSNNAAERGLRCVALGRKSWLFCGSDRGGRRAADMYGLIVTCKMNGVDPPAWLASPAIPHTGLRSCCPGTGGYSFRPWRRSRPDPMHVNKVSRVRTIDRV